MLPDIRHSVTVVVPMYRDHLEPLEAVSLSSIRRQLAGRRIVVVHPEGVDVSAALEAHTRPGMAPVETLAMDASLFDGIRGYNRLMTTTALYDAFADSDYILIAQLDAYIFRDDLDDWLSRGYDYVGAPWLQRPVNRLWPMRALNALKDRRRRRRGDYERRALYDRVGNGGLSLRRVASLRRVCAERAAELAELNSRGRRGLPEDVFWSTMVDGFRYPTAREALGFAFDKYPRYCYRLTGGRLPMGCHAWYSRKMRGFWSGIIDATP